tara:strand:- start:164 stop:1189 length:1026 start_codon:yes stop_codon:yes gene_type:complete
MFNLITGGAGFIGFHLCKRLLERKTPIIIVDNMNSYYDKNLKIARLNQLNQLASRYNTKLLFKEQSLENFSELNNIFDEFKPKNVINLAAQAGVRYSIENPKAYIQSNLVGFNNILELCIKTNVDHFVYASSSSVYGGNKSYPYKEVDNVDHPVSLYAATKKSNELIAHSYSHLYGLPTTGLRFFTVYGPWGRPDMALFLFTKAILNDEIIDVFNNGDMIRDFTYIDDVAESILRVIEKRPIPNKYFFENASDSSSSWAPYKIFNVGNSNPTKLMDYINALEDSLGKIAKKNFLPLQPGDVEKTYSDNTLLESWINFKPNTTIKRGISEFVYWYKDFYNIK